MKMEILIFQVENKIQTLNKFKDKKISKKKQMEILKINKI